MTDLIWVISSSVLIIAVTVIRAALGKRMSAGLRYALWGIVLVRLLIPGMIFSSPVSIENAADRTEIVRDMEAVREVSAIAQAEDGSVVGLLKRPAQQTSANEGETKPAPAVSAKPEPAVSAKPAPAASEKPDPKQDEAQQTAAPAGEKVRTAVILSEATPERFTKMQKTLKLRDVLNVIWYTGMGLAAVYFIAANLRFYLRLRKRRERIGEAPGCRVYSVEGLTSSCLFLNSIYVSKETANDAEKLRYVLAHERAHFRHGDSVFALLRSAAIVLHWYNPLVWLAAFLSRHDSELFADAGAVSAVGEDERERYGKTLIELSARSSVYAPIACAATMMTSGKAELKSRITHIAKRRRMGLAIAAAVLVLALAAVGCSFIGGQKKPDENGPKTTEAPTEEPTATPTEVPTEEPTAEPTEASAPTEAPAPTEEPTPEPTATPEPTPDPIPTGVPYLRVTCTTVYEDGSLTRITGGVLDAYDSVLYNYSEDHYDDPDTIFEYNERGDLVREQRRGAFYEYVWEYNEAGRPTKQSVYFGYDGKEADLMNYLCYDYDEDGKLVAIRSYFYDDRLVGTTEFDEFERPKRNYKDDPEQPSSELLYEYDEHGEQTIRTQKYYRDGELVRWQTDRNEMTYDENGRVTERISYSSESSYGNEIEEHPTGKRVREYDEAGRLIKEYCYEYIDGEFVLFSTTINEFEIIYEGE
ncbi:MAG: hypothetical protein K6G56_01355 [Clostridiales bacterium]|nr:hypothetical protein [Clostridiales bacterium]